VVVACLRRRAGWQGVTGSPGMRSAPPSGGRMNGKRQVLVFTGLVLLVSWAYEALLVFNGGVQRFGPPALVILMCIPGLLSVLLRLIPESGFADAGFVLGSPRYSLYAVAIPLTLALLTGLLGAILDIRQFALMAPDDLRRAAPALLPVIGLGLLGAFGEELGWRGYLLPKMVAAGIPHPYLASGLVWACWHLPLIAFGGFYATDRVVVMVLAYAASIVAMTFIVSALRMRSGSVWVATLFHAAHNVFFQIAAPVLVFSRPGTRSQLWDIVGGDSGFAVAGLYALTFLLLRRHEIRAGSAPPGA
jgi:membrane protease YdiL (CAAX protease family)